MVIIDSFTGREVKVGDPPLTDPHGRRWRLINVFDRSFYDVMARVQFDNEPGVVDMPLQVRFLHPDFIFTRVAFVPT